MNLNWIGCPLVPGSSQGTHGTSYIVDLCAHHGTEGEAKMSLFLQSLRIRGHGGPYCLWVKTEGYPSSPSAGNIGACSLVKVLRAMLQFPTSGCTSSLTAR